MKMSSIVSVSLVTVNNIVSRAFKLVSIKSVAKRLSSVFTAGLFWHGVLMMGSFSQFVTIANLLQQYHVDVATATVKIKLLEEWKFVLVVSQLWDKMLFIAESSTARGERTHGRLDGIKPYLTITSFRAH